MSRRATVRLHVKQNKATEIHREKLSSSEPVEGSYFVSSYPPFSTWGESEVGAYRAALGRETGTDTPLGLYVHIPFCDARCRYCYYLSEANPDEEAVEDYVDCVLRELEYYSTALALRMRPLSFLYFGGGTPSMLSPGQIRRMMAGVSVSFSCAAGAEATFECAPKTATPERLKELNDCGVTRLSIGVQQLDDEVLRSNGRIHSVRDVEEAVACADSVDFDIVNLDLIVGLVNETEESFFRSLEDVIALGPESVTLYQLEIPFNTPLARALRQRPDEMAVPSWETKRQRLSSAFDSLESAGYTVRSAYAAVRDPVKHRFVYQEAQYHGADLIGVGASAFSYLDGVHHQNIASTDRYRARLNDGEQPFYRAHALSSEERMIREFVLQLKLGGCMTREFRERFDVDVLDVFAEPLARFEELGWIKADSDEVRVTRAGLVRVDRLIPAFYREEHQGIRYS